jgi:hypothetical protein
MGAFGTIASRINELIFRCPTLLARLASLQKSENQGNIKVARHDEKHEGKHLN